MAGRRRLKIFAVLSAALALVAGVGAARPALADQTVLQVFAANLHGEQAAALRLARRAMQTYVATREKIPVPAGLPALFSCRSAVFVSAMIAGAPRCCMGTLYPTQPSLAREIIEAACAAAGEDYRFPPVRPGELARMRIIVSVVGPPVAMADPADFDPVTEGAAARWHDRLGVVLPGETADRDRALAWARIRAGLPKGARPDYFRLRAVRAVEPPHHPSSSYKQ